MAKTKALVKNRISAYVENGSPNGTSDIKELGQSLRLLSQENVELTHDFARELLALPTFVGERPKRKRHVASLHSHMQRGTFQWNFVNIVTCRCNEEHNGKPKGSEFRMNGQHTCSARLEMPPSYRAPIRHIRYTAATVADMRRLYATIDRNAPRTLNNVVTAYILDTEEFSSLGAHVRKYLPPGMALWKWESHHERGMHDGEDIACLLLKSERTLTLTVGSFLSQWSYKDHKHIMRAPVVAAMLETFSANVSGATEFWTAVASGLGFTAETQPQKRLYKLLMTSTVMSGVRARGKARTSSSGYLSSEAMYRACIIYWNAWRRGETLQSLRLPEQRPSARK